MADSDINPNNEAFNEGMYADEKVAQEWISWIESIPVTDSRHKDIYPWLSTWIAKNHPSSVLEIGSGQAICSEIVELRKAEYIGIEPSAHLRDRAQQLYPTRDFRSGRAEHLPIETASVDAAFSVFVWFHVLDLATAAKELSRVLKLDGAFAIVTANPELHDLWISWHQNAKVEGKELRGDMERLSGDVMYLHTFEEVRESLLNCNLVVEEVCDAGFQEDDKTRPGFALIISGHKKT